MSIDDVRCVIEGVILPVVAWLAKLFGGKKDAPAAPPQAGADSSPVSATATESPQIVLNPLPEAAATRSQQAAPAATGVAADPWAAYRDKQASLEAGRMAAPPTATAEMGQPASEGAASVGRAKRPRWISDFLPGALGALVITLGSAAYLYFTIPPNASEEEQGLLLSQLLCLPVTLVMGALFGAAGALLTKRIMLALHAGERTLTVTTTIGAFISGALTGFLCDFFAMMSAAL